MYKKNIENVFEIGSHKIDTETFTLDKLSDREKKILDNAIKGGIITVLEDDNKQDLLELYNEDSSIVDTLNLKDLKKLCKLLDIKFTNEAKIREHLKSTEPLEETKSEENN